MRKHAFSGLVLLAASAVAPLFAAPVDAVRTRINGYRELGAAFKAINDGLRGDLQSVLIQQSAKQIRNAARLQYSWFPAGSGPQAGLKTAARAEIWTQPAKFKAAQDAFSAQAEAFQKAAAGGQAGTIRAEAKKLGAACKACHVQFRVEKN